MQNKANILALSFPEMCCVAKMKVWHYHVGYLALVPMSQILENTSQNTHIPSNWETSKERKATMVGCWEGWDIVILSRHRAGSALIR